MAICKEYSPVVAVKSGPYHGAALVGTHSASIAWSFEDESLRQGLLGFAVKRSDYHLDSGELVRADWLKGQLRFESDHDSGADVRSCDAPFQRFRWSDYTLRPGYSYVYEVYPVRGAPGRLERNEKPLRYAVVPSPLVVDGIGVYANRGVTSAFAYLDRFHRLHPGQVPDGAAYRWLSRGLKESILEFIRATRRGEALHVCIYEFFDHEVATALKEATGRGVDVVLLYHDKKDNKAAKENRQVIAEAGLAGLAVSRSHMPNLSHNKFMVRLKGGRPASVYTGTANFTENAFHYQTNMGLRLDHPRVAADYEACFQILRADPPKDRGADNDVSGSLAALMQKVNSRADRRFDRTFYSPLRTLDILDAAVELIAGAESCVFVSSPFGLDSVLVEALKKNPDSILEYGLANATAKKRIADLDRRNTRFFTPTRLETYMGRAWDSKAFGQHKIHTKVLVVDPWGEQPKVLFGSANFSKSSCRNNDENAFLAVGDKRLAAIMATEFLRMFDHYKSRAFINQIRSGGGGDDKRYLSRDGGWMKTAFKETARSHKFRDRKVFAGD